MRIVRFPAAAALAALAALTGGSACSAPQTHDQLTSMADQPTVVVPEDCGVLLIAHGGDPKWNGLIEELASQARPRTRIAVGFLFDKYGPSVQDAYDTLAGAEGTGRIVAVPLLVSGFSGHAREVGELVGIAVEPPKHAGPAEPDGHAGEASQAEDELGHDHIVPIEISEALAPVIGLTPALNDNPILASILLDRSRELSRDPASETVILVAHGPNGEEDAQRWMAALAILSAHVKQEGGFREVTVRLLRDDADIEIRDEAFRRIREAVEAGASEGDALVVPVLMSQSHVLWQITSILEGLEYAWSGRAILPDPRVADWIVEAAADLAAATPD